MIRCLSNDSGGRSLRGVGSLLLLQQLTLSDLLLQVFQGNVDNSSHQKNLFQPPFFARYVRLLPWAWQERITLRLELLGCDG